MRPLILFTLVLLSRHGWTQPEHYQVYALKFANMGFATPISVWVDHGPQSDSVDIDFSIWLIKEDGGIKGSKGRNILVDAGFLSDLIDSPDGKEFAISNYHRPDSVLQKLGLKAEDITDIILSHPHWDHCDGIGLFPNAHIWIQKEDFNYFVGTAWQKGVNNGGFYKRDVRELIELNPAGYVRSMVRMKTLTGNPRYIIPGHDARVYALFPKVADGVVRIE